MPVNDVSGVYGSGGGGVSSSGIDDVHARWRVEYKTLLVADLINKYVTIAAEPKDAAKLKLEVLGGPAADIGVDFTVNAASKQVSWNALSLDGQLVVGEKLRITYFEV